MVMLRLLRRHDCRTAHVVAKLRQFTAVVQLFHDKPTLHAVWITCQCDWSRWALKVAEKTVGPLPRLALSIHCFDERVEPQQHGSAQPRKMHSAVTTKCIDFFRSEVANHAGLHEPTVEQRFVCFGMKLYT